MTTTLKHRFYNIVKNLPFKIFCADGAEYTDKNLENNHMMIIKIKSLGKKIKYKYAKVYFKKSRIRIKGKYSMVDLTSKNFMLDDSNPILFVLLSLELFDENDIKELVEKHYKKFDKKLFIKNILQNTDIKPSVIDIQTSNKDVYITINDLVTYKDISYLTLYKEKLKNYNLHIKIQKNI